jgi:hypothetical protein
MALDSGLYLRDLVARLEETPPSVEAQASYAAHHPRPVKPRVDDALITVNGVSRTARGWAKSHGWPIRKIEERIAGGWHPVIAVVANRDCSKEAAHQSLETQLMVFCRAQHPGPVKKPHRKSPPGTLHGSTKHAIEVDGVTKSATAWAKSKGWTLSKVYNRINCGWDPVVAVRAAPGMGKEAAHALHKRPIIFVCQSKSHLKNRVAKLHTRVVPSRSEIAVACMHGDRIEFAGSYTLTPDKADELALNLIRMAGDIRKRYAR